MEFLAGILGFEVLGYAVMGNHWHLVVWPREDMGCHGLWAG